MATFYLMGHGHPNAVVLDPVTPAVGTTPIAVTPASLDLAVGSGGFGGNAVFPGTGTSLRVFLI